MAEYYPLLSKAVGSLPNSTPDTRRVVYERARKALIGQLRTLHPPVPDEDIERESVELDRAIERLEGELAAPAPASAPDLAPEPLPDLPAEPVAPPPPPPIQAAAPRSLPPRPPLAPRVGGALGPAGGKPFQPLRTRPPVSKPIPSPIGAKDAGAAPIEVPVADEAVVARETPPAPPPPPSGEGGARGGRIEPSRPIAPQPPTPRGPKRQMWIIWVGLAVVALLVAGAAWKLRDHPETLIAKKPADKQAASDNGKIAERVGKAQEEPASPPEQQPAQSKPEAPAPAPADQSKSETSPPAPPTANNPEVPVAQRAALLVEAPDEASKVKTYLGNVVWKLNNNVSDNPSDAAAVAVEATVDLQDDKLKAVVTFEKNSDSSLPASHTIKIRFQVQPGSPTGDIKQISVPQLRKEDSPSGEPLAGVTVPVIQNSFLVGLSPGNAETTNMDLLRNLQWIDVPMLLSNGKIAKLTFEKGAAGQRDLEQAIAAWQKQ